MKKFFKEFKEFALKGNMIDLAIGMIIGSAFTAVVNNLVTNIFNPLIGLLTGGVDLENALKVQVAEQIVEGETVPVTINFGAFIAALINFIIMAFVVFLFVKGINKLRQAEESLKKKIDGEKEAPAPTTKKCPYCQSEIDINATRCPHCTSELPE